MYGSDGPGGDSGGPGGGSEAVFGTDVRNRCSDIHIRSPPRGAAYWGGSDGPGGDSGGPGGGSETVFGTDVRNRQCLEQCSEPTKLEQVLVEVL